MENLLTMRDIPSVYVSKPMFRLGALFLAVALVLSFGFAGTAQSPALATLAGGNAFACGLGTGFAAGLGIAGFLATGSIVGLPAGAVLGASSLLVGAVTAAFCA
jgi:hypothetical protein